MRSPGINGELRGQPANPVSPGKWPLKWSVCECGKINFSLTILWTRYIHSHSLTGPFNFSTHAVGMAGFPKSGLDVWKGICIRLVKIMHVMTWKILPDPL